MVGHDKRDWPAANPFCVPSLVGTHTSAAHSSPECPLFIRPQEFQCSLIFTGWKDI